MMTEVNKLAQGTINTPRETTIQRIATALENILNKIVDTSSASNIDYDNTESELDADKVQGAIDELASEKADKSTTLAGYGITNAYTKAEVDDALNNNVETIAEAIKQWDIGSYTIDLYGIGSPETYYHASSTYSGDKYLDVATGKMYDCLHTGADTYIWRQAPVVLQLKSDINASAIEDLQEDISQSLTATGNPITIESSESNLVECTAKVEAYQDLHGYDYPWVGGAGKNLLSSTAETVTKTGVTYTMSDNQKLTVSGVATGNSDYIINLSKPISLTAGQTIYFQMLNFTGTLSPTNVGVWINEYGTMFGYFTAGNKILSYTATSDITISKMTYRHYKSDTNNNYTVNLSLSINEELTTFEPYSNISPITGQTEVVIGDVGKNLFDTSEIVEGTIANNGDNSENSASKRTNNYIKVTGGSNYIISGLNNAIRLHQYKYNKTYIGNALQSNGNFTVNNNCEYIRIAGNAGWESNILMIRLATETDATYEPYKGKTYTIQLGDTIYGGELDVLTGELTVTHGEVDLGTLSWIYQSQFSRFYTPYSPAKAINNQQVANAICSQYIVTDADSAYSPHKDKVIAISASKNIIIVDTDYSDPTTFKNAMNGVQLVYELAEPYTIQLTPQQIRLLKGTNHLSCNTGDLSIKYYPDNVLGQLKGDIESEYDERVEVLEDKANNALKIKSITTTAATNQQGISTVSYDYYVQGDKKFIPLSITAKAPEYEVVDVHYVLDETNRLIYFIPKDLTGNAIPSGRTVSMTIRYFEI
jgi:hypothetical protein